MADDNQPACTPGSKGATPNPLRLLSAGTCATLTRFDGNVQTPAETLRFRDTSGPRLFFSHPEVPSSWDPRKGTPVEVERG